jgi:hypothetical protein
MLIYKVRYGITTSGIMDNVVEIEVEEKPKVMSQTKMKDMIKANLA